MKLEFVAREEYMTNMNTFEGMESLPALSINAFSQPGFKGLFHRVGEEWIHYDSENLQNIIYFLSLAMREIGVGKGVGVGIIAPSSPQWIMVDLATQICGGYTVPLFSNISSTHFEFQVKDAQLKVLAVDLWEDLSPQIYPLVNSIETLIHFYPLPDGTKHKNSFTWNDFIEKGKKMDSASERETFSKRIKNISRDEIFSIIYTSGSTGIPKGVPLTQGNMILQLRAISEFFPVDRDRDTCMSILPVAHIFERMVVYYFSSCGLPVYFADSPNNVGKYLPEIRPSIMTVVPRILEKLYEKLIDGANKKPIPVKWLVKYAINKAQNTDPSKKDLRNTIWDKLVYSKMRAALGDNFYLMVSGSSALNVSVNRFLRNIGLALYEGYGLTETSPVISAECPGNKKMGSVGKPLHNLTVRISNEGEIQVKGPSVFGGYFNRSDLKEETFTEDGFFRTGDKGRIDRDGYIWITGRLKEMFKTSTGKYVSPVPIEQALCQRAFIEAAQVFAEGRKFTSAILFLNQDIIRNKLKKSEAEFDPVKALKSRRINSSLQKHVDAVNKKLNDWEKIKKWKAVFATLSTENGLLTPTLKLRRRMVEKIYVNEIDEMYE
ncbi:MAG: AMP-binding protein [Candidatus Fibromonas sp.]|jgi:long-chain acyl-CoA synthetase|nr:AMP-binding protein [Candidatus Fibromonas sp.]